MHWQLLFEDYSKKSLGLGSDDASTMTGLDNGVAAIMKHNNPYLTTVWHIV